MFIYRINVDQIDIKINNIEELTRDESLEIINANVIALCVSIDNSDICELIGFGMYAIFFFLIINVCYNILYSRHCSEYK